jgi:REP element-mobilizing transposase RayT
MDEIFRGDGIERGRALLLMQDIESPYRAHPALARSSRAGFRVIEFSVQDDHVHLIAEAADRRTLSGGVRGLAIRLARAVNRTLGRRGQVWGSRYHARALTTPRAVRHVLIYVLNNSESTSMLCPDSIRARLPHGSRDGGRQVQNCRTSPRRSRALGHGSRASAGAATG